MKKIIDKNGQDKVYKTLDELLLEDSPVMTCQPGDIEGFDIEDDCLDPYCDPEEFIRYYIPKSQK